jgi:hypothetical protein
MASRAIGVSAREACGTPPGHPPSCVPLISVSVRMRRVWLRGRSWDVVATSGSTSEPLTIAWDVPLGAGPAGELVRSAGELVRAPGDLITEAALVRSPTPPLVVVGSSGGTTAVGDAVLPALAGGLPIG